MSASAPGHQPPQAGPAAPPPVVDTAAERDRLDCPLCGYSLRGLTATAPAAEPRCPECGYPFAWHELLRARQHRHPYLFEHGRDLVSLFRTLTTGLRPRRFWSSLNAGHRVRPPWIVVYALAVALLTAISVPAGHYVGTFVTLFRRVWRNRPFPQDVAALLDPALWQEALGDSYYESDLVLFLTGACVAWPWITLASLLVFRTSMRRGRVGGGHVLRCVVYSGDVLIWTGLGLVVGGLTGLLPRYPSFLGGAWPIITCVLPALLLAGYRLRIAYRHYLRFEHADATVLASQVIYLLAVAAALGLFYDGFFRLFW